MRSAGVVGLVACLSAAALGCGRPITARQAARHVDDTGARAPSSVAAGGAAGRMVALAQAASALPEPRRQVVETALAMTGAPAAHHDCSSFTQHLFALAARRIPRTVRKQLGVGDAVADEALQPGDLVFFSFSARPADHVGIYTGQGSFVHVSSSTRTVRLESFSKRAFAYTHVASRRVLDP